MRDMREIDRKCAEILGWKNVRFYQRRGYDLDTGVIEHIDHIIGDSPDGIKDQTVPFFSSSIMASIKYLIPKIKESNFHLMMTLSHETWKVTVITGENFYSSSDDDLPTAIAIAFVKTYEGATCLS